MLAFERAQGAKPLTKAALAAYEAKRDLAAELLQSVREMKAGQFHVVSSPVIEALNKTGLSQSQFAVLLGVSVRTLQGWEQGRFVRFHGLAQWVGWLWPYAAMAWLLGRLGSR